MTRPDFTAALAVYLKIGFLSFGGPAGQIALMQSELVDRRQWVPGGAFDRGLSFAMMLPGPEAQQLATWLGWRLHGLWGGLAAGLAFVVPGAALMIALAWLAAAQGDQPLVQAIFGGIQPMVIAVVIAALARIAQRSLKGALEWGIAIGAFAAIWGLGAPFPLIVALAALIGWRFGPRSPGPPLGNLPAWRGTLLRVAAATLALTLAVLGLTWALAGPEPWLAIARLFTSAAIVTFGGAYAVLPYVAERAVESYHWLTPAQMLNGLAIAEATPGPLVLVNTYVGFFAGWSQHGSAAAGVLGGVLATFYTFAPSFLLILGFAPIVERVQQLAWARRALAGVSAAVVGVIGNLVIFLAEATFLPHGVAAPDWIKLGLFALALGLVFAARASVMVVVASGAASGLALHAAGVW